MSEEQEDKFLGYLLSQARKKKRLRYKKLSSDLKIPESYLQALEEEDYEVIPGGEPYIKGYLRSYAKKLELDPDLIIQKYERYLSLNTNNPKTKFEYKSETKIYSPKTLLLVSFFGISVLLILSILVIDSKNDLPTESLKNDLIQKESGYEVEPLKLKEEIQEMELGNDQILESETTYLESLPLGTNQEIGLKLDLLEILFLGESWVEIQNLKEIFAYKLVESGSTLVIEEEGPFKVIIGNSKNVSLFFNKKNIDLLQSSNRENNVSCVVLPAGKCSEFPR